ncbi:hypothetical protein I7X12_05595 [Halosimplex litoreum]|uniref:Uncharacterized protein n=1 Tax=Halosimplex litoreum TaxID=1198301 RepID=A0A7T3G0G2_9EURY|nr:hypothetical protein [Halosimplex litoreum]QPV64099.1 hypothetical protein I7X12_05595 [Halosimplex litoreum]
MNASLALLAGGTVGGEAATAQSVVASAGSESAVVRGGVLAASSGGSIQDTVAQVVFLTVAGLGVFGVVVAVLQLVGTVGGGGSGERRKGGQRGGASGNGGTGRQSISRGPRSRASPGDRPPAHARRLPDASGTNRNG